MGKRKQKDTPIEMDTDPIGVPKRKRKSKKGGGELANLILEGRSEDVRIVTVHTDPPKKKNRLFKPYSEMTLWDKVKGCVFWVFAVLVFLVIVVPPSDKDTQTPQTQPVASGANNTDRPSSTITPIIRGTTTAEAVASMMAVLVATPTPTQTPIVGQDNITATPSETDIPTQTSIPTDVPLPSATPVPSATPLPTNTPVPTQSGVRQITDTGIVTGQSVRVRGCASTECAELGRLTNGDRFPVTGSVANGQSIEGNSLWYEITYQGQVGYVSATLVGLVSAQPVSPPVGQNISPVQPTQPIVAPVSGWNCSGDRYNCPDFGSGGQFTCPQLFEYMSTCPNDPSKLDRDQDGRFCEAQCG